ncbi:hypothetical protein CMT41_14895 [Colwellia sp. MT41]|uniref:Uncharacterized protein n=1 Tax=Colwellia marinimaniae TaxID=1513592 RepID=A0ABQ0MQK8_9GAMM|nr:MULTISPECIES: hypothetical protein [Colwellia]ALO35865.1 hypothetical protein CMT41_14895 [Colwellia sp. MT41]GAW94649.1 hypothetical protein MTCD1_00246 [Colwellia marinimaniae]
MINDARKVFRDWLNSPRYKRKLRFQLCSIGDTNCSSNRDEYTLLGLNSRLKWSVHGDYVDMWVDLSGVIAPNDKLIEWDVSVFEGYKVTPDNFYILDNPNPKNKVTKHPSFAELLIDCFTAAIAVIEEYIQEDAYIYVFACNDGGSMGGIMPMARFQCFLNRRLARQFIRRPVRSFIHIFTLPL